MPKGLEMEINASTEGNYLIGQLTEAGETSIYVADYETDELLYLNSSAREVLHIKEEMCKGQTCYEYLMHRTSPCPFCHKSLLSSDKFSAKAFKFPFNGREYRISSKIMMWGDRKVHAHYITDLTELLNKEKELRALTDKIPAGIGIFYVYSDGRIEQSYLNDGYFKMIDASRDSRMNYSGFEAIKALHPDDEKIFTSEFNKGILTESEINFDVRVRKNNGVYMWIQVRAEIYDKSDEKIVFYCSFTDIDELKNTLNLQEESKATVTRLLQDAKLQEKRFKNIMEHVPGAMVVFEAKDKLLYLKYISDACINITGFTAEETYARSGPNPLRDAHPKSREYFLKHEWEDIKNRKKISYKYQLLCKDGNYKWASLSLSPVEEEGRLLYFGVLRDLDVDEQKYQEKENYYNQLVGIMERATDDNLIAKGRYNITTNKLVYYKKHGEEALLLPEQYTFDQARERMIETAATADQREVIARELDRKRLLKSYREGTVGGEFEYKRLEKSGAYFWTRVKYTLCSISDTNHIVFFVYTYNITRNVLEKSMLSMLGTTEYEVMGTIDIKTHYFETQAVMLPGEKINKQHELASGNYDEIWSKLADERIPDYERKQFLENMKISNVEENLKKNSSYFMTYSVLEGDTHRRKKMQYCYLDDLKETIFYYRSDITAIYEKEQEQIKEIEKALKIAREANNSKTEFFSRMSHDMRTPMNGILGLADLSLAEDDPIVLKNNISKIHQSGQYLLSLINDTLDYQRIESGKLTLEPQPIYCRNLVDSVLAMIRPSMEKKNITLSLNLNSMNLDCYMMIDPVRSRQIFINLLSNAIKFTPEGGRIDIECDCLNREEKVVHDVFIIRDTGIGMSEEFIKTQLFKPFAQENNEETKKYAGSGLGLSIVHSLVEMMGGTIEVQSEIGTGTTFTLKLDFERSDEKLAFKEKEELKNKEKTSVEILKGKKILLAEDHPLNAEIAEKLLKKAGCNITWVENGQKCVDAFKDADENYFDLILMDIRMPILDGLQATKAIRKLDKKGSKTIPILAMTANAYDEDVKKSFDVGMNGHISKPIVPIVMYEKMASVL